VRARPGSLLREPRRRLYLCVFNSAQTPYSASV
jgi:hypothetical protein